MYVGEMVRGALQSWGLGTKTLDRAEKKRIGMDLYSFKIGTFRN